LIEGIGSKMSGKISRINPGGRQAVEKKEDEYNIEEKTGSVIKRETVHLWCDNCGKKIFCAKKIPVYICCQSCGNLDLRAETSLEFECLCGNKGSIKGGEIVFCCKKRTVIFR